MRLCFSFIFSVKTQDCLVIESLKTSRDPGAMNEYLSKIVAVGPRSPAARQDVGAGLIAWLTETRTKKNRLRRPVRKIWENIGK
jgi:hypothetical protein